MTSRTDALLETLRYAPRRVITEKLAEHAYRLEDELQQASDAYDALRTLFEHFMKGK